MPEQNNSVSEIFRKRFETFNKLTKEMGEEKAWGKMFEGYPERHKKMMGQFIDNDTLAGGFTKAIHQFKKLVGTCRLLIFPIKEWMLSSKFKAFVRPLIYAKNMVMRNHVF